MLRYPLVALLSCMALLGNPGTGHAQIPFGFNDNGVVEGVITAPRLAETVASINPDAVLRFPLTWAAVQSTETAQFDWSTYDGLIQAIQDEGLQAAPYICCAPPWAYGLSELCVASPCVMPPAMTAQRLSQWQAFVGATVDRYQSALAWLEIWNEPNSRGGGWTTLEGPNPYKFANLVCRAHDAARSVAPTLPVISAGLSNVAESTPFNSRMADTEFLTKAYGGTPGIGDCIDGVGIHPYPQQKAPDSSPPLPVNYLGSMSRISQTLDGLGDPSRPLWITEFGVYTGTDTAAATAAQQAAWNACGFRMSLDAPSVRPELHEVGGFLIHQVVNKGFQLNAPEQNWGLYARMANPDASPSPKGGEQGAAAEFTTLFETYGDNVPPTAAC